jgi:uncharacterized protein YfaS (alpha-2-macroglobulin family)
VKVQTVEVKNDNSTVLTNDDTKTMNYKVFNVTTFEKEGRVDLSAGGFQRVLTGLEYLVRYPHGCVEQTTSPGLAGY